MRKYWALRIDRNARAFFSSELAAGRLRFGWGYQPDQDLREIRRLRLASGQLTPDQKATWRRGRRLLPDEIDGMQIDDIVLLPNFSADGQWSVARITGGYDFQIPPLGDYGHFRLAESAVDDSIDAYDEAVAAPLRGAMKNLHPLWSLDPYAQSIELLLATAKQRPLQNVPKESERLISLCKEVIDSLSAGVKDRWHGGEFEKPCQRLLEALFGGGNVTLTAGKKEHGADHICTYNDPLGTPLVAAVQVKMYDDEIDDQRALEQIRDAHANYFRVASGVILTTADRETDTFRAARAKLETDIGIPVRCICRQELMTMFLRVLPDISS